MTCRFWLARVVAAASAVVLLAGDAWPRAAVQVGTGAVAGTVMLTSVKGPALATSAYGRRGVAPKASAVTAPLRNVIIYVAGQRPATPPAPMRRRIAQREERFDPPVTAITVGSTVEFPNEDPFFHNVFSLSKTANFDLGRYQTGISRTRTFPKAGIVKVFCHLHAQMSALIMVLDHPWFTIPADDGTFTLPQAPAGDITVVAWHERIGERHERLRVTPNGTTKVSFRLPVLEPQP